MKDINVMTIDLEMNQPSGKIIQIGGCVCNVHSGKILEEFSYYINCNEKLSEYIIELTCIKQSQVDNGISLEEAYKLLAKMHKEYSCFRNLVVWGDDSDYLRSEVNLDGEKYFGGRRCIDVKTIYVAYCFANNINHRSGVSKSMSKLNLQFQGRKHNALYDAKNTFLIYRELLYKLSNPHQ